MDRRFTYTGQVPLVDDFLEPQRAQMVALGTFMRLLLGSEPIVEGLVVAQTQPATMAVTVSPGAIYGASVVDAAPYGELPAVTNQSIVKQGILAESVTLPLAAGTVAGQSRNFLVQAAVVERDEGSTVLPYFNADNPNVAWSGPGNTGAAQPTRRVQVAVVSVKAGAPAATGSQITPSPDAGYLALATIVVPSLSTSVPSSAITNSPGVPRFPAVLQQLRPALPVVVNFATIGSSVWTVPAGVRRVKARVWGGGGGGGAATGSVAFGSGGGAGGYSERTVDVTPGQQISITVGTGGAGALVGASLGGAGGTSSFGTFCTATGGAGGQSGTGVAGLGGSGAGGDVNMGPANGLGGFLISGGGLGGQGGSAPGGGGQGANHAAAATQGNNGIAPGGGGGGCGANTGNSGPGGNGARGQVVLEY